MNILSCKSWPNQKVEQYGIKLIEPLEQELNEF